MVSTLHEKQPLIKIKVYRLTVVSASLANSLSLSRNATIDRVFLLDSLQQKDQTMAISNNMKADHFAQILTML